MRIFTILFFVLSFITTGVLPGKAGEKLSDQLTAFKKNDDLESWIDLRIEYATQNPKLSLSYLQDTETKAWRKPVNENERIIWAYLLINQGYYELYNGDILNSINKYEEAYSFAKKYNLPIAFEEYILKPLANNYTRIGDFERAIFIQKYSLDIALSEKNDTLAASIHNNLAISQLTQGKLDEASGQVNQGLKLCNETNRIYGLLHSTKARVWYDQQQFKEALNSAKTALNYLSEKEKTDYWQISAHEIIANVELRYNNYKEAEKHIHSAINLAIADRKREISRLYVLKSKLYSQQRKFKSALQAANTALSLLSPEYNRKQVFPDKKSLYPEIWLQLALIQKSDILSLQNDKKNALKGYLMAAEVSEMLRSGYTYRSSKKKQQEDAKENAEKVIETAYQLWIETRQPNYANLILETSEKTKARMMYDELKFNEERLASKNKAYAGILQLENTINYYEKQKRLENTNKFNKKIEELRFQLSSLKKKNNVQNYALDLNINQLITRIPDSTLTIVFFSGLRNTYLITASNKGINNIIFIPETKKQDQNIGDFLNTFFYNGPNAMMNKPKTFFEQSYQIYEGIFGSIPLKDFNELMIVKDGIYSYLSFDGLITKNQYHKRIKEWPFLVRNKKIRYQPSLNQFRTYKKNNTSAIFSGFFLSETQNNPVTIPSVNYEYSSLKSIINGSFYSNEQVNSNVLKKQIAASSILHISSHAHLSDSTSEPILELYKDKFYFFEIEPGLSVPQLVILNACETGNGQYINGEGVESLGRAFLAAGSRAVISSLWNVNDESGARLLINFYQNLLHNKDPKSALRNSKLAWINDTHTSNIMALPYYWDSLVYTGEPVEIKLDNAPNKIVYLVVLLISLFLIIPAFFFFKRKIFRY